MYNIIHLHCPFCLPWAIDGYINANDALNHLGDLKKDHFVLTANIWFNNVLLVRSIDNYLDVLVFFLCAKIIFVLTGELQFELQTEGC